ncbi:MAG: hypothetical protein F2584_09855 [Actinobacteria bacterium]|nr:hypothetical protein [Actinomycetota bacterium]
MTLFRSFLPSESLRSLRSGDISLDRIATVGAGQMLFLYDGSNDHFGSYSRVHEQLSIANGQGWANLTAQRHARVSSSAQMLSLFVPNTATCLSDLYPLPLDRVPTPGWEEMRRLLKDDTGVMFCDDLFEASLPANRYESSPWQLSDSHWSDYGSLLVTNSILRRVAVAPIEFGWIECEPQFIAGDLGARFGDTVGMQVVRQVACDLPIPRCVFDSGGGSLDGASMGRRVEWECQEAPIDASMLVVGNSFSGTGLRRNHLVYWFSRLFRRTVFLHAASLPTDVVDAYRPDIVLFQGLERFMRLVPVDEYTAKQCEAVYEAPHA